MLQLLLFIIATYWSLGAIIVCCRYAVLRFNQYFKIKPTVTALQIPEWEELRRRRPGGGCSSWKPGDVPWNRPVSLHFSLWLAAFVLIKRHYSPADLPRLASRLQLKNDWSSLWISNFSASKQVESPTSACSFVCHTTSTVRDWRWMSWRLSLGAFLLCRWFLLLSAGSSPLQLLLLLMFGACSS